MTRSASLRFLGALALVALAGACADVGPEGDGLEAEVARQRQIWEARRPENYVVEVERQCFCGVEARGPVRVTVSGARVTGRVYSDSGAAVPEAFADLFPSVDGLFDILEDALARPAENVDVTWDAASGAPSSFFIDYSANIADEEVGYRILSGPS
jgi:hypothetical protein